MKQTTRKTSIAFGVWLSAYCINSGSKDGWYIYEGEYKTTDECFDIFNKLKDKQNKNDYMCRF